MSFRQSVRFWSNLPQVLPQALYVRKPRPRFAGAGGVKFGIALADGSQASIETLAHHRAEKRLLVFRDSVVAGVGASRPACATPLLNLRQQQDFDTISIALLTAPPTSLH